MTTKPDNAAQQRARACERSKLQEANTGIKALPGGSSGLTKFMQRVGRREFADIESSAERVAGFPFVIQDYRSTINGSLILTVHVPGEYEVDVMTFKNATRLGFCWTEGYLVPRPMLFDEEEDVQVPAADEGSK